MYLLSRLPLESVVSCDFDGNTFCSWEAEKGELMFQISVPEKTKDKMPKFDNTKGNYLGILSRIYRVKYYCEKKTFIFQRD